MSEVQALLRHYAEVRNRLRYPPNAVPDTGINLRIKKITLKEPEPIPMPERKVELSPPQQIRLQTYKTSFCRTDVTFRNILKLVAADFEVSMMEVTSRRRTLRVVLPRQITFYLAHKHIQQSLASMGRHMGLDHTSVLHGRDKIKRLVATDPEFRQRIEAIEAKLLETYPGLAVSAVNECDLEVQSGPGSQVGEIFPVDKSCSSITDGPEERPHQDVEGEVYAATTAI